jgi:hypothetical protein
VPRGEKRLNYKELLSYVMESGLHFEDAVKTDCSLTLG